MGSDMVNPNILLQARNPNVVGSMAQGDQAGFQVGQMSRDAAMQRLMQSQGANIAAGDQGAVNMLAQFDPMAARGIMAEEEAKRRAAAAASARAQQEAEAREAYEEMRGLAILHHNAQSAMAGGPTVEAADAMNAFNSAMSQSELSGLGVDFDTFPEISQLFNEKIGTFLNPEPVKGVEINDQLVNPFTGDLMGDYQTPEQPDPSETVALVAPDNPDRAAMGLPNDGKTYQVFTKGGIITKYSELGGSGVSVTVDNRDGGTDKFYETVDSKNAAMMSALSEEGMRIPTKLAQIDQLQALLSASPTGAEAAFKTFLGNWGIQTEGLDTLQAAQAVINQLVPEQRQPGSGPMSDADLELFKQSLPRLINTPGGNELIANTMRGILLYQNEQAEIATKVVTREMTPSEGIKALRSLKNPLQQFQKSGPVTIGGYRIEEVD